MTLFVPRPSGAPLPAPTSHRQQHVRHLYSVLHLCLLRGDHVRARTAWRILTGCRETNGEDLWRLGLGLNVVVHPDADGAAAVEPVERQQEDIDRRNGDFIESLMRGGGRMSIPLLQLHVNHLLSLSPPRPEQALERLEIFLPGLPYAQSSTLHALAGMCALALSVDRRSHGAPPNLSHNRQAAAYIQKAISLLNATTATGQGTTTSLPTENRTFYTALLQLVQESARWGELEQAERRSGGAGGGGGKARRRGGSSSASPPPLSAAVDESDDSEADTANGSEFWRRVKREQYERQDSLSATSDITGSVRQGSVQLSESSAGPAEDAGMDGAEAFDDDDDDGAYDMDED